MQITKTTPIAEISKRQYEVEKLEYMLHLDELSVNENYIARILLGTKKAGEYLVRLAEIEHKPKRSFRRLETWGRRKTLELPERRVNIAIAKFQALTLDLFPIEDCQDSRAIDEPGFIRNLADLEAGYLTEIPDIDISFNGLVKAMELPEHTPLKEPAFS